jgi:hypothetical protein
MVRQWVGDFKEAIDLLEALSQQGWRRLSAAKAGARTRSPHSKGSEKKHASSTPKAPS